jgi:hypothetical protein
VAYVPSPSFSSCWNELGCLLSMPDVESSISRFCILIVLGTVCGRCRSKLGEGGKVRKGGRAEGLCRVVKCGSNRREEGVTTLLRMANAVSFDPSEAVMEGGG